LLQGLQPLVLVLVLVLVLGAAHRTRTQPYNTSARTPIYLLLNLS
jgi:hypothetical protein